MDVSLEVLEVADGIIGPLYQALVSLCLVCLNKLVVICMCCLGYLCYNLVVV